jgi:hypothetical protein
MIRTGKFFALPLLMLALFAGCQDFNPAGRTVKALYALPEKGAVLVFVYDRPGSGIPLDVSNRLAVAITKHLNKWTKTHEFINPDLVTPLKQDPKAFAKLDVMTIAHLTGAKYVLVVDLYECRADEMSSGLITQGNAQALLRVVDDTGTRLWPARDGAPMSMATTVAPMTSDQQSIADVKTKLVHDLSVKIGRTFHEYGTDQAELNPK